MSYCSLKAQSFHQVIHYPFVPTSIKYDNAGNEYVLRQQGSLTMNGDTIKVFPTLFQNECGAIDFDFMPDGFVIQISGQDSTQKVIRYDTVLDDIDTLISVPYKPVFSTNHRGGSIVYRDSIIYVSFGYGTLFNDAQKLTNYKGKLIEYNMADSTIGIIAYGLRNPFRFAIEGENCYIGDVGWNSYEEIDYVNIYTDTLVNFGWPCWEGPLLHNDTCGVCTPPVYSYPHGGSQSVIGGCFYNGYWYWTDHYTGLGGKIDTDGNNIPIDSFPQYTTSMTVYPFTKSIRLSTWGGWIYEMTEAPLALGEEPEEPYVNWDSIRQAHDYEIWLHNTILFNGEIFYTTLGQILREFPTEDGIYYSFWRNKWVIIIDGKVIYATPKT
jgi:hypothetical protein